jgi:hypothetical protein
MTMWILSLGQDFPPDSFHFTFHPLAEIQAALLYKPNYKYILFRFILKVCSRLWLRVFTSGFLKHFFMHFSYFLWSLCGLSVTSSLILAPWYRLVKAQIVKLPRSIVFCDVARCISDRARCFGEQIASIFRVVGFSLSPASAGFLLGLHFVPLDRGNMFLFPIYTALQRGTR